VKLLLLYFLVLALPLSGQSLPSSRIAIRKGRFVETSTGKDFRPLGVNYYRTAAIRAEKRGHAALAQGSYDESFITGMMGQLSRDGFNTVRTFLTSLSGEKGIVQSPQATEVNPSYLANLIHFLKTAQKHGLHVILCWDTWPPDCQAWSETPLPDEARHGWVTDPNISHTVNGFRLTPGHIRAKANAIRALINGLRKTAPELPAVVLAWELENEVHFTLHQEPFLSKPTAFAFGGRQFDLSTDIGVQALMDASARSWANACADAIHAADAEALVSTSVFTFAAVGRVGPQSASMDRTKDNRVPARPLALLDTRLDFVDLHLYGGKTATQSVTQRIEHDLRSIEIAAVTTESQRCGKPILIGESGVAAHFMRRGPEWQTIHHDVGHGLFSEFHRALAGHPFAGVLHWHYGSPDSTAKDEHPALLLFPEYGERLKAVWKPR
jgi:Cellulase (glycosyl hydrolase family 5)